MKKQNKNKKFYLNVYICFFQQVVVLRCENNSYLNSFMYMRWAFIKALWTVGYFDSLLLWPLFNTTHHCRTTTIIFQHFQWHTRQSENLFPCQTNFTQCSIEKPQQRLLVNSGNLLPRGARSIRPHPLLRGNPKYSSSTQVPSSCMWQ